MGEWDLRKDKIANPTFRCTLRFTCRQVHTQLVIVMVLSTWKIPCLKEDSKQFMGRKTFNLKWRNLNCYQKVLHVTEQKMCLSRKSKQNQKQVIPRKGEYGGNLSHRFSQKCEDILIYQNCKWNAKCWQILQGKYIWLCKYKLLGLSWERRLILLKTYKHTFCSSISRNLF